MAEETNDKIYAKGVKKNFPGVKKKQYYNLADMQACNQSGTTDTDRKTDPNDNSKGYASIYQKHGEPHSG